MPINPYFDVYNTTSEQDLLQDLIVESIKQAGMDVYYVPRVVVNEDKILNEQQFSKYEQAVTIEAYIRSIDSFEGDGMLMQKFGVEIRDSITLIFSLPSFSELVTPLIQHNKPREGDMIFIPMLNAAYTIRNLDTAAVFYQLGKLQMHQVNCDLFEYNNEEFSTGVPAIDNLQQRYEEVDEAATLNTEFQDEANDILDFSEHSPFAKRGVF